MAFTTCPAVRCRFMRNAQENLGVPNEISSFAQPLGATINMDGTAIYQVSRLSSPRFMVFNLVSRSI